MRAIEEGYQFFDFLRGDEPYKAHFRATPTALLETRFIAPRMVAALGHRLWKAQRRVKLGIRARRESQSLAKPSCPE
jgi:CelD/BcsL family acetyltransferase involved in cellulose biosynthesis